jgi:hypothetical protein
MGIADLPPRDSAAESQGSMAAEPQTDLAATVADFLARVREELAYNAAKGDGPYRQGMHDGLRFSEDALVAILDNHVVKLASPESPAEVSRLDA